MVLSKRERTVFIATVAFLGAFVVYHYMYSPLMEQKELLDGKIADAQIDLGRTQRLIRDSRGADQKWLVMASGGLRKDASEAESQLLNNVREWAQDSGMNLPTVTPQRPAPEKHFSKLMVRASGTSNMSQLGRLLWRIQTAEVPVLVSEIQVATKKDGTDDLKVDLAIETIYMTDAARAAASPAPAAAPARTESE